MKIWWVVRSSLSIKKLKIIVWWVFLFMYLVILLIFTQLGAWIPSSSDSLSERNVVSETNLKFVGFWCLNVHHFSQLKVLWMQDMALLGRAYFYLGILRLKCCKFFVYIKEQGWCVQCFSKRINGFMQMWYLICCFLFLVLRVFQTL